MIPERVRPTLAAIDAALTHLETDRMAHFIEADQKYRPLRRTKYLGFERLITCELYTTLQQTLGDNIVFAEFPGFAKDRIDLWLNAEQSPTYIELKMFYSDNRGPYEKDFNKLREMVDSEEEAMAVQIHFHFYPNRNHAAESTLREMAQGLPEEDYWSDVRIIKERELKHFVRLAFGRS